MGTSISKQAELIAARVPSVLVGMDPVTILTIISQVLPLVIACWNKNDEPNAQLSAVNFKRYFKAHPELVRRRIARRVRAEADAPMSKEASFIIASAIIAQALESPTEIITACCLEAPAQS